jgi:hypothetical protein
MSTIRIVKAYANNEVAELAWELTGMISGCLGFEITRINTSTGETKILPAWVPFKGQSNPDWLPQNTSVAPIQKLNWRDLTLRKRSDRTQVRPIDFKVRYKVRAVVKYRDGLEEVGNLPEKTYKGTPIRLGYSDEGKESNEVFITNMYGNVRVTFTNGILSAQWLKSTLEKKRRSTFRRNCNKAHERL